jgi:CRISPR/Cas system endoribonuclease Cas6 (RAMP superfamily)
MKQYKSIVQTIQNIVNTSIHITKTPTQLSNHPQIHTPTHYKTSYNNHSTRYTPNEIAITLCFLISYICPAYKGTSNPHQFCPQVPVFCALEKSLSVPVSGGCINISLFLCFIENE